MEAIKFSHEGSFENLEGFLKKTKKANMRMILDEYGALGVAILREVTPKDTGKTAASWTYEIKETSKGFTLSFLNDNRAENGDPIVILLQMGHATPRGNFVKGRDFINPAMQILFEELNKTLEKEGK